MGAYAGIGVGREAGVETGLWNQSPVDTKAQLFMGVHIPVI